MYILRSLCIIILLHVTLCQQCPAIYKRFSATHTFCQKSTCNVIKSGVTEEDKKLILKIHNDLRSKLATGKEKEYNTLPSAANMMQIEWDDELAKVAQAHANLCKFEHDSYDQRAVDNFGVGQNLLQFFGTLNINWKAIDSWYTSEVPYFKPEYIDPFKFSSVYGHFSQVIWAKTWKVGCGVASFRENGEKVLYTCNYGPFGNLGGASTYIIGSSCSQCPKNTKCSDEYPGLCKSITSNGPQVERPSSSEYPLYCDFSKEDGKNCQDIDIVGSKNFNDKQIYIGTYKTVILNSGDKINIKLGKFKHSGGLCPFILCRMGPNIAGQQSRAVVDFKFSAPGMIMPETKRKGVYTSWTPFGMLMKYDGEMEVSLVLQTEEGAPQQYFDIKVIGISGGKCPR